MQPGVVFVDETTVRVGDLEFSYGAGQNDSGRPLHLLKHREMIEWFVRRFERLRPRRIVELGIHRGGSAAFFHQLADPDRIVAIDISPEVVALTRYISERELDDTVVAHYGVDQADGPRLADIVGTEFRGASVDLVVDDASHLPGPTRAAFDALFPHVRAGGLYVIEDWNWDVLYTHHMFARPDQEVGPLVRAAIEAGLGPASPDLVFSLVVELALVSGIRPDVISNLEVDGAFLVVERGPAPLETGVFAVGDLIDDRFRSFDLF